MLKQTIIFILALSMGTRLVRDRHIHSHFRHYMSEHGKIYDSLEEYHFRLSIFQTRLTVINKWNDEQHSWKKGKNIFTDLSVSERRKRLGDIDASYEDPRLRMKSHQLRRSLKMGQSLVDGPSLRTCFPLLEAHRLFTITSKTRR